MRRRTLTCRVGVRPCARPVGARSGSFVTAHPLEGSGMEIGMATTKVTVTLPSEQVAAVRALVGRARAKSVSAFVQQAVATSLGDVAGWGALLAELLAKTGGPLTDDERAWADGVLGVAPRRKRKKRAR